MAAEGGVLDALHWFSCTKRMGSVVLDTLSGQVRWNFEGIRQVGINMCAFAG